MIFHYLFSTTTFECMQIQCLHFAIAKKSNLLKAYFAGFQKKVF